jgi:hypothetical protein
MNSNKPNAVMMLVPPHPSLCQECAIKHPPEYPHNKHSLFYQTKFCIEHKRYPTWMDAMAHCDQETKDKWSIALIGRGEQLE